MHLTGKHRYPPARSGTVVVWGLLAREPYGGMTWQVLHYLVGLRRLGFDVWYVEDSDSLPSHPRTRERTLDPSENIRFLQRHLDEVGLGDRWAYRTPKSKEVAGHLDHDGLRSLYRRADAVLNICGAHELLPHHRECRNLVYVETDPFLAQIQVAQGDAHRIEELDAYRHLFTYGINLGTPACSVPISRYQWHPTVPPVVSQWWTTSNPSSGRLTTVSNLRHTDKAIWWDGRLWKWSKHEQFQPFIDLPMRVRVPLEMAVIGVGAEELETLHAHGWLTRSGWSLSEPSEYREFIRGSMGEFSVAKEQYVVPMTGWISDRSVCYLAAGRPVIVEDTAAGLRIPTGQGMLTFHDPDSAVAAIEQFETDPAAHARAASELAHEFFEAERVLADLMDVALGAAP